MVERPREELYQRINLRVHKMIEQGLVEEAQQAFSRMGVLDSGVLPNSLNTVGYKELLPFIKGEYTLDRAIE